MRQAFLTALFILVLSTGGCSTPAVAIVSQANFLSDNGNVILATYFTNNTVILKFSDSSTLALPIAISGSGSRYANENHEWWEHHGEATYSVDGKVVFIGNLQK